MTHSEYIESASGLNEAALLESVGRDLDFLVELVGLFLAACPTLLSKTQEALAVNDFAGARRAASILKGSLRNFGAGRAEKAAEALEAAACQRKLAAAEEAFRNLEDEIEYVTSALSDLEHRAEEPAPQRKTVRQV